MAPKAAAKTATKAAPKEEDKKRKAEDKKEDTGPKKEAKKDDATMEEDEVVDEGEKERDAPADKRPVLKQTCTFLPADTTLNVVPTMGGKVLMSLSEGGMQYMISGARANIGITAGRYMYEVKIIEALNPSESSGAQRGRVPMPRQLVRLGFSTSSAGLVLGDTDEGVCFDSEGHYVVGQGKKSAVSQRFTRDQVMGVVLNLDPNSPNANTVSLFREGERIAEPQLLPENLHGKTLFPHVSFRSVTVQMLFGPTLAKALPFKCRMLQDAAQADVTVQTSKVPKDGKYEVLLPVAFPDEGTFDWLDDFLAKNPHYVEISDRKILEWAASSGLWKPKGGGWKASNDKPEFNFGLPGMDDGSLRRIMYNVAPVVPRHYVIMEVKSNLMATERKEILNCFSTPHFKKVAHVVMGEPNDEYKNKQLDKLLQEKQEKADIEWKAKKAEEERKKQVAERQAQLAKMRKDAEEKRKKVIEEAQKKRDAEAKKKADEKKAKEDAEKKAKDEAEGETKEKGEDVKADDVKKEEETKEETEETKDEEIKEELKDEVKEEEEEKKDEEMLEESAPQVELTDEDRKCWFRPTSATGTTDLTSLVLSQSFGSFTIPEEAEGFDELRFEWQNAAQSKDYLRKWVLERKLNSRIEELQPGQWFNDKIAEWQKVYQGWQNKQKAYKNSATKKAKDEAARKREEAAKKADEEGGVVEDAAGDDEMDVDIFSVVDLNDVGNGEPLFSNFNFEDWALLQLRMEMYFLQLAFRKDVDDPERPGILETHLAFYYNKYYRKTMNAKHFGVNTNVELCTLVKDTVKFSEEPQVLTSMLAEETDSFDIFVRLTEEHRRERQRRIDAGDETAKLKFSPLAVQPPQAAKAPANAATAGAAPKAAATSTWSAPRPAVVGQYPRPAGQATWQQAPQRPARPAQWTR